MDKSKIVSIKLEILEQNYWEHFKFAKDLAQYFPISHPKRQLLDKEMNSMLKQINALKQ